MECRVSPEKLISPLSHEVSRHHCDSTQALQKGHSGSALLEGEPSSPILPPFLGTAEIKFVIHELNGPAIWKDAFFLPFFETSPNKKGDFEMGRD